MIPEHRSLLDRFQSEVLSSLKAEFVAKDDIIDLMGVCLIARENIFLYGPPGTAKSALVNGLARRIQGQLFDYLLTRFTEPNELFGPFDISRLRDGELVTNTEGMLPRADIVFLDELLNANSAILNSLLMALNERIFRRGRETSKLPALFFAGASNHLPEEETLQALFDRFLVRVECGPVPEDQLEQVLDKGWQLERAPEPEGTISAEDIRSLQSLIPTVDLAPVRQTYLDLVRKLRSAGLALSDRRAVRLQRVIASSALLCGRQEARDSDLWVLKHIWDRAEQSEVLAAIVNSALSNLTSDEQDHPRANPSHAPDAEKLSLSLEELAKVINDPSSSDSQRAAALDQLRTLASRLQWLPTGPARQELESRAQALWPS
ncbi:AAA family ATPase [Roseibacillus persicicus]|uniref:AAA family ATPase n=1 Tax=Roseibacillus persicicus TaxID=454148 RepID=UPI00398ACE49